MALEDMKVLFVCTGNSCRSVMAEFLLRQMAREKGLKNWEARSCGIAADPRFPTPAGVQRALGERGIEVRHTPRHVEPELLEWADLVLAMAKSHRHYLIENHPQFKSKVRLFLEHTQELQQDVADPIGQPDSAYLRCRDVIERGLKALLGGKDAAG